MSNPVVSSTCPQQANVTAALFVSDQIDQAGPVKGVWDAKNGVYWPAWSEASFSPVACGTSGKNGLVSSAVNCGIALAPANDHTGTVYDFTGAGMTIIALFRPVNTTANTQVIQNGSPWSATLSGWSLNQSSSFVSFSLEPVAAGTGYNGASSNSGALVAGQMTAIAATRNAGGTTTLYKNGTQIGIPNTTAGNIVYGAAGNDRRAALFNNAQSRGTNANPMEIYAVIIWDTVLTPAEIQQFGTSEANLLAGSFYQTAFSFGSPTIDVQPTNQSVNEGATATFSLTATTSGGVLLYQWQRDSGGWGNIAGATSPSYGFATVLTDNGATFRCIITDDNGSTTSNVVTLTVTDVTAPTLSLPSTSAIGSTSASFSVTTTEGTGTLFYLASANATETSATVIATGASQAVSAPGAQPGSFTGLTPATAYYPHFAHRDAANNVAVNATTGIQFTTTAAAGSSAPIMINFVF